MSKHSGLSQLADAAFAHYPVRRKGERRRLNPNTDGIKWLEGEAFLEATRIVEFDVAVDGLQSYLTSGWHAAKRGGNYVRPMFQVFGMEVSSSATMAYTPCPDCDNWARTSKCETHHDLDGFDGLVKGSGRRRARADVPPVLEAYQRILADTVIVEVNGETLQGVREVSFQIEGGSRGQETVTYRF